MAALYNWLPCFSSSPNNPKNRLGYEKVRLHEELGAGKLGRGGYRHTYDYKKDVKPVAPRVRPQRVYHTTTPSPPPVYQYQYAYAPAPTPPPVYCSPAPAPLPPTPPQITYHCNVPRPSIPAPNPIPIPVITKQNYVPRVPKVSPPVLVMAPTPPPAYVPSRMEVEMHARTAGPPAQSAHIHYATGPAIQRAATVIGRGIKPMDSISHWNPSITTSSTGSKGTGISAPLPPTKGVTGGIGDYYARPALGPNSGRHPIYAGHPWSGGGHFDPMHRDYTNRAILSTQPPRVAKQTSFDPGYWYREPKNGFVLPPLPLLPPLPPLPPMQALPVYQPYQAYGAYNAYAPHQPNYQMVSAPPVPPIPQGHEKAHLAVAFAPAKVKTVKVVTKAPAVAVAVAPVATTHSQGFPSFPNFPSFPGFPDFPTFPQYPKFPQAC